MTGSGCTKSGEVPCASHRGVRASRIRCVAMAAREIHSATRTLMNFGGMSASARAVIVSNARIIEMTLFLFLCRKAITMIFPIKNKAENA